MTGKDREKRVGTVQHTAREEQSASQRDYHVIDDQIWTRRRNAKLQRAAQPSRRQFALTPAPAAAAASKSCHVPNPASSHTQPYSVRHLPASSRPAPLPLCSIRARSYRRLGLLVLGGTSRVGGAWRAVAGVNDAISRNSMRSTVQSQSLTSFGYVETSSRPLGGSSRYPSKSVPSPTRCFPTTLARCSM